MCHLLPEASQPMDTQLCRVKTVGAFGRNLSDASSLLVAARVGMRLQGLKVCRMFGKLGINPLKSLVLVLDDGVDVAPTISMLASVTRSLLVISEG